MGTDRPVRTPVLKSAPGRIRTADHLVRSQVLYPAELRAPARSLALPEQLGNLSDSPQPG